MGGSHLNALTHSGRTPISEIAVQINYAIVFVSDMKRSIAFYRDAIGLTLRFESPGWTEFATEGATLALHLSDSRPPAPRDHHIEPPGQCRPGFRTADLSQFHQRMLANQVTCLQEPREMFGARIAQYVDPDGLVFSVSEARGGR